jgi:glycosyltransferase involved in cell wall biosynthesis
MRILILHSQYLSGWASGENSVVRDEERLLTNAGHNVVSWTPLPGPKVSAARLAARAVWSQSAIRQVRRLIRNHAPEIVHCHNVFPMLSPAVLRAGGAEAPKVVVTLHNYRMFCLPATFFREGQICELCLGRLPWRGVVFRCYRESLPGSAALAGSLSIHRAIGSFDHVSLFLPVSRFVRDKHVQGGLSEDRMVVKPNFCWPKPRREGLGAYFLYAGRLAPEKDVGTLLEAWKSIPEPLIVVGDGPQREALQRMAPANVEFRGTVSAEGVTHLLQGARALLFPTKCNEGGPRSVIEAYAAGVPVIGTALGALPELIEPDLSGLLVSPGSSDALIEAVQTVMDPAKAKRLAAGAYDLWAGRYSPEKGLQALERAYQLTLAS